MNKNDLYAKIKEIPVFDTHTHLVKKEVAAKNFWDIAHYFWFLRELQGAGYPKNRKGMQEKERRQAFIKAFQATYNTSMNWVVRQIFKDLYDLEITDINSISEADERIKSSHSNYKWPQEVAAKLAIKKTVVNIKEEANFKLLKGWDVLIPRIDHKLTEWIEVIESSRKQKEKAEEIAAEIEDLIANFKAEKCKGIMFSIPGFKLRTYGYGEDLKINGNTKDEIIVFLLHQICQTAEANNLFIQLFIGMEAGYSRQRTSVNDPEKIVKLHGLFEKYTCDFELVLASEINTLDVVQAARMFTNVYLGGLWWFNFRESSYYDTMQKRFEALSPSKCSLVVSDARCIEWCYGKNLLIKYFLINFLDEKISSGWINEKEALRSAKEWLYSSAEKRYL